MNNGVCIFYHIRSGLVCIIPMDRVGISWKIKYQSLDILHEKHFRPLLGLGYRCNKYQYWNGHCLLVGSFKRNTNDHLLDFYSFMCPRSFYIDCFEGKKIRIFELFCFVTFSYLGFCWCRYNLLWLLPWNRIILLTKNVQFLFQISAKKNDILRFE